MGRTSDLLIDIKADSECVIGTCSSFEEFCKRMIEVNETNLPSLLTDIWEEHVYSQES